MPAYKILVILAMPLSLGLALLCLSLACAVLGLRRTAQAATLLSAALLYAASCPAVSHALTRPLESPYPPMDEARCPKADAIVVLGGGVTPPRVGDPVPRLTDDSDRVWQGARLYRHGCAPRILLSGGGFPVAGRLQVEAPAMLAFIKDLGVPEKAVDLEPRSRTTEENALESYEILRRTKARTILLVTSAYHMRRAAEEFTRVGLTVIPAPADLTDPRDGAARYLPDPSALRHTHRALKEWMGIFMLQLRPRSAR
jgi:uncharacterized SAM-binding protein YcdF (DUF218 family)